MKPFFFGESTGPLFGIHHSPEGRRRGVGVLVCGPFGQEALRAHRSLRDLSTRLATAGFDVLRFDCTGCGDSAGSGEDGSVVQWSRDVALAAEELTELAGGGPLALVGLRLGGTLAALHVAEKGGAALVLWDPVLDGQAYLAELETTHRAWMRDHAHRPDEGVGPTREVLGFPLTEALARELEALRLPSLASPTPRLVVSSAEAPPEDGQETAGIVAFPPAPVWLHAEGMDRALVPAPLLEHVVAWLGDVCP